MGSPLELEKSPTTYLIGEVVEGNLSSEEREVVVKEIELRWRKEGERNVDELDTARYHQIPPASSLSNQVDTQ